MYGSCRKIQEGAANLGTTLEYNGEEGSGYADIETHINGHSEGNTDFCIRDAVGYHLHQEEPGGVPPPGGTSDYWEATKATIKWEL